MSQSKQFDLFLVLIAAGERLCIVYCADQSLTAQSKHVHNCRYNSMMASVVQEGDVVAAEQWFARMQLEGISPNVITFGTMING